jgi:hypothetical protein
VISSYNLCLVLPRSSRICNPACVILQQIKQFERNLGLMPFKPQIREEPNRARSCSAIHMCRPPRGGLARQAGKVACQQLWKTTGTRQTVQCAVCWTDAEGSNVYPFFTTGRTTRGSNHCHLAVGPAWDRLLGYSRAAALGSATNTMLPRRRSDVTHGQ